MAIATPDTLILDRVLLREPDLGAVVDDRRAGQRELAERCQVQPPPVAARDPREAIHVMVVEERGARPEPGKEALLGLKERRELLRGPPPVAEGLPQGLDEREVEAAVEQALVFELRLRRLDDLAEQPAVRVRCLDSRPELGPELRTGPERVVQPEAVDTALEPERCRFDEMAAHLYVGVVQRRHRLHAKERVVSVRPAAEAIPPEVGTRTITSRRSERRMEQGHVARHKVEHDTEAGVVRSGHEAVEVGQAPEAGLNPQIIRDVIAVVRATRVDGVEPNRVRAEVDDVAEAAEEAEQGPAVAVGRARALRGPVGARACGKAIHEHLVDDRLARPRRCIPRADAIPVPLAAVRLDLSDPQAVRHDRAGRPPRQLAPVPAHVTANERVPVGRSELERCSSPSNLDPRDAVRTGGARSQLDGNGLPGRRGPRRQSPPVRHTRAASADVRGAGALVDKPRNDDVVICGAAHSTGSTATTGDRQGGTESRLRLPVDGDRADPARGCRVAVVRAALPDDRAIGLDVHVLPRASTTYLA